MGGEYEMGPSGAVDCHNCLFAEVCRRTPVICSFHAGLLEGLLERSSVKGSVEALGHRDTNGCAYVIRRKAPTDSIGERSLTAPLSGG